jgi:chemotaxis protein methyltransferase CheR
VLNPTDIGRFDIILCRNVLIYFSDSSIERAAKNFHQMLVPGGHLLLGHSESFCRINTDFVPVRLEGVVVYQKQ